MSFDQCTLSRKVNSAVSMLLENDQFFVFASEKRYLGTALFTTHLTRLLLGAPLSLLYPGFVG